MSALRRDGALLVTCLSLVVLGCFLRIQQLGFPGNLTFDEDHFVNNARTYQANLDKIIHKHRQQWLTGDILLYRDKVKRDYNDHPPLGKLLLVPAMMALGDQSLAWRLAPLLAGLLNIVLGYALARTLFRDRRAGWLAAAFVAGDGFLLAYSRTALLDGMLTCFMLASGLCLVRARRPRQVMLAALLAGLATSIKLSGVVLVLPLVLVCLLRRRRLPWWTLSALLLIPVVYYLQYALGFALTGRPAAVMDIVDETQKQITHHLASAEMKHPKASHWYTWLLPTEPITLRLNVLREPWLRAMSTLGNPLLWWAGSLAMVSAVLRLGWLGPRGILRRLAGKDRAPPEPAGFFDQHFAAVLWLVVLWLAPLSPWMLTNRDPYIYHYLPSYAVALVLVAGLLLWLYRRRRAVGLAGLLLVANVSVYYAPVWAQLPLTREGYHDRLFLRSWR